MFSVTSLLFLCCLTAPLGLKKSMTPSVTVAFLCIVCSLVACACPATVHGAPPLTPPLHEPHGTPPMLRREPITSISTLEWKSPTASRPVKVRLADTEEQEVKEERQREVED